MKSTLEMNVSCFKRNLLLAINEVLGCSHVDENIVKIVITPVVEAGKPLNAVDDIMRLVILSDKNVKNKEFSIDQAVALLTGYIPLVPIWVDVSLESKSDKSVIVNLSTSLRMRKPSLLRNADSGHPPFRSIKPA